MESSKKAVTNVTAFLHPQKTAQLIPIIRQSTFASVFDQKLARTGALVTENQKFDKQTLI